MAKPDFTYAERLHWGVESGLSLRRLADTNRDNPERQVRLSFLG